MNLRERVENHGHYLEIMFSDVELMEADLSVTDQLFLKVSSTSSSIADKLLAAWVLATRIEKKEKEKQVEEKLIWCPEHKLPLVRLLDRGGRVRWDCPGKMTREQQQKMKEADPAGEYNDQTPCFYHVHE